MLNCPKFIPGARVEVVEPESVFILTERSDVLLSGRSYCLLAPLITGHSTSDEIVDFLADQLSAIDVYYALMKMEQQGYIVESDDALPAGIAAFSKELGVSIETACSRLNATKVAIKNFTSLPISAFTNTFESLHIQVADAGELTIVFTDDYLHEKLADWNQIALKSHAPWMIVKPVGTIIWLGPIFCPEKTGCWQCLSHRLQNNRVTESFLQQHKKTSAPLTLPPVSLNSTLQSALGMVATELFKWIVQGENKRLERALVTFDTLTLETRQHTLVKRPQCSSCGNIPYEWNSKPHPLILGSRKKLFIADGGHRHLAPQDTLKQYLHHLSPITGVVRQLEKVHTGSNEWNHTYVAWHYFPTSFDNLTSLRQITQGKSAGKGKTDEQAKASGLCEAIERYSGIFQGDEIRHKSSYQDLGNEAIHPNACMHFSEMQYREREPWNTKHFSRFQHIPEPFDEERLIEWTPIWSLTHEVFKYLPTAYCYYGYPQTEKHDCWADSNGCAAGNTLEEAILQGFMELVERDSVALWWYNRIQRPAVDLDSFNDPYFQSLIDYYHTLHRKLWVLDLTSDLNIPVFAAISRRVDQKAEDIVLGFGAHFDPKIAVLRALTEANQLLSLVLPANADGSTQYPQDSTLAVEWWQTATIENQSYLVPSESMNPKNYADYPQRWSDDLLEDVMTCKQIAEQNGMEVLVLNQTRPDIGLKVVKVIVPGMRHFWRRLGAGRLYESPVKLGWLKESLSESQLNPFPLWM